MDAEPPIASSLKSALIGGGPVNVNVIRLILMKLQQQLEIANRCVIVAVLFAWLVGVSGLAFISIGIAAFGFAVLYPGYKFERGIWMLGLLFMSLTAFMIFAGLTDLHFWFGTSDEVPRSSNATMWMVIGMATQITFFAFTVYTSAINYRLSRTLSKLRKAETPGEDGG